MIYQVAGGFYHNYENAHDAAREMVDNTDLYEYLQTKIDLWDLFNWCFQNDAFLEHFEEQILEAEEEAITDLYFTECDFYSDEEEEEFKANVEFLDEEEE